MKNGLIGFTAFIAILVVVGAIMYGCYWVAKTVSYTFFYESMVQETVREMVKQDSLKK